jgi:hypothetical protein
VDARRVVRPISVTVPILPDVVHGSAVLREEILMSRAPQRWGLAWMDCQDQSASRNQGAAHGRN